MPIKLDYQLASSGQIEADLCYQLLQIRLGHNITQAQLADEAGASLKTISRMEKGLGVSLDTFIRVIKALKLHGHLQALMPFTAVR